MSETDPSWIESNAGGHAVRVAYWGGDGPRQVLALHGFSGCGADFAPLAERLGLPLWAPDLLGHAGSVAPATPAPYAFDAQAYAVGELANSLQLTRPVLVGYSFGARLALRALTLSPERFEAAVLIGAAAGFENPKAREARIADDTRLAAQLEAHGVEAFLAEWAKRPIIATQARIDPAHRARMQEERGKHTAAGLAHCLREAGTGTMKPLWDDLGAVNVPVLLVTGADDTKFHTIAQALADRLPKAEHAVIQGAGHCAHLEAPDAAAGAIKEFLARL